MEKSLAKEKKKSSVDQFHSSRELSEKHRHLQVKKKEVTFPTITRLTQQHDSNNLSNYFFLRGKLKKHL